ncbi:MAG: thymidylate kinase [Planctomycetota bacterium]|nr:MAG: thymidylate kinase [Planctomycetota bacterium]
MKRTISGTAGSRADGRDRAATNPELTEPTYRTWTPDPGIRPTGDGPVDISDLPGRLIAVEGTDAAGRSTQIALLREFLETRGFGVSHTGLTRGRLAGDGLKRAKAGSTLGQLTLNLFYATDFADRLENEILPALRAGFVVLTDRYVYSVLARSIVRGMDEEWLRDVYRFAPPPHAVLYLKVSAETLVPRVLTRGRFDYWESGLDFQEERDLYQSFVRYQKRLLKVFDDLAERDGFQVIDANRAVDEVFLDLRAAVERIVASMKGANA